MATLALSTWGTLFKRHSIIARYIPVHSTRSKINRLTCASSVDPSQNGGQEKEKIISIREVLDEAATLGDNFIFEDDSDEPVWELEEKLQPSSPPGDGAMPQIKRSASGAAVDITSAYSPEQGFQEISMNDFHLSLDDYSLVLDVRTADEFKSGHVPNAVNVPLQELNKDSISDANLEEFQAKRVAVICASGGRSAQATVRLSKVLGFEDVTNVTGGTLAWISAGFPVDK